jgi:hypothetical protein
MMICKLVAYHHLPNSLPMIKARLHDTIVIILIAPCILSSKIPTISNHGNLLLSNDYSLESLDSLYESPGNTAQLVESKQ